MITLSAELHHLLQKRVICFFATILPDGAPHMTRTWVDTDGTSILINSVEGHQKLRNVRRDPRVMISIVDPAHSERAVNIRGRIIEITREGLTSTSSNSFSAIWGSRSIPMADLVRCVFC